MKLLDNLYAYLWPGLKEEDLYQFGNNCNNYVIANAFSLPDRPGHVIIDPGHIVNDMGVACLEKLRQEMKRDGLKSEDVGLVINTHSHRDHSQASQSFQQQGAKVAIGELEAVHYQVKDRPRYQLRGVAPELEPDMLLKEGELPLNGLSLQVLLTPGHTPGHISLYWAQTRVLIVGDVIFHQNTGRVDLPGGSGEQLKASIERLSHLEVEYLLTGHQYGGPGVISGKEAVHGNFAFVEKYVFPYL